MSKTTENLKVAFAGESQANRKYTAFAEKAEKEGFPVISRLFRATAEAEAIHARYHLRDMEGIKSTLENLEAALSGEVHEYSDMYPPMVEQAKAEGHRAKKPLGWALEAEKVHAGLFEQAISKVKEGKDLDDSEVFLCPVCGHLEIGKPANACPICGLPADKYTLVSA